MTIKEAIDKIDEITDKTIEKSEKNNDTLFNISIIEELSNNLIYKLKSGAISPEEAVEKWTNTCSI